MASSGLEQVFSSPKVFLFRETYPPIDGRSVSTLIRPESGARLNVDLPRISPSVAGAAAGVGTARDLHEYRNLEECPTALLESLT